MKKSSATYLILMSTGALLFPGIALAQQQSSESVSAEDSQDISGADQNVIIVTARGREEDLQSVPLDITAFNAEALEEKSIDTLDDIARFTPGLTFETLDGAGGAPTIRGISQIAQFNREQTTAVFYDNIYLPRSYLFDATTEGLARVEVVKGPQSSRFGRNAFAGAINYIPKKANLRGFSAEGFVTYGSDERFDIGGNVNLTVIPDMLAIFGSYAHTEFDGSWTNDNPQANFGFSPGTNGNVGGRNNESWSAGFIFRPAPSLTIEMSYFDGEIRDEANATRYNTVNGPTGIGNCGTLGADGFPRLFCGPLPEPADTVVVEPRGFGRQVNTEIVRAAVTYEVSDNVTASYLFGRIQADSVTAFQSESDPVNCGGILNPAVFGAFLCNFQASPLGSVDYDSHEARISYQGDNGLTLALGGYYLDGTDINFFISASVPALNTLDPSEFAPLNLIQVQSPFSSPLDPERFRNFLVRIEETKTETKAIFAEASYAFNDGRTRVSAEGRYTWEEISTENTLRNFTVGNSPQTFKFLTPRFTVEHDATPDTLVYASVARGAKAGGFNAGAFDTEAAGNFDPEFNWTYEIGLKNTLFNRRLTLNIAAFYTDWTDQQLRVRDPTNPGPNFVQAITTNVGNAEVYGIEGSAAFQFENGFSIDGNAAYISSKFAAGAIDPLAGEQGQDPNIDGNFLPRSPEFTAALGVQYDGEINPDTSYFVRLDGSYQSKQFADPTNNVISPGRTLVNTRVGLKYKSFSIDAWAKNVFDKKYAAAANFIYQTPPSNNFLGTIFGERRTFGVTARFKY